MRQFNPDQYLQIEIDMTNMEKLERFVNLGTLGLEDEPVEVFVDVDDTLVFWCKDGSFSINGPLIDKLEEYHTAGKIRVTLWSQGGAEHCKEMADECGITSIVSAFLTKPAIAIDDIPFSCSWGVTVDPRMRKEIEED